MCVVTRTGLVGLSFALACAASNGAAAQAPVLVGLDVGVAIPLSDSQSQLFGSGVAGTLSVRVPLTAWLVSGVRLSAVLLADGAAPRQPGRIDPGLGGVGALTLSLRVRPFAIAAEASVERAVGGWIEVAAGGVLTGDLVRPVLEGGIGWGFDLGAVTLSPALRVLHVVQFSDPLDDGQAVVVTAGLEVTLLDARAAPLLLAPLEPPASDRDGDGIIDDLDACPDRPEDLDGDADDDGCPEDGDRDGDLRLDSEDACPDVAEDFDVYDDDDGCPDPDADGDRIHEPDDLCPHDAEVVNGIEDADGCPDEGLIELIDGRVILEETVLFELSRSRVRHAAFPVLDAIVVLWLQHPEWVGMRVEGHADERGSEAFNLELSTARAERVRDALVARGLPAPTIVTEGFGASRPRDLRRTEAAFQANRRVEFIVVVAGSDGGAGTTEGGGAAP